MNPMLRLALLLLAGLPQARSTEPQHALMPVPTSVAWRDGKFRLDSTTTLSPASYTDERLRRAIVRTLRRL
jgi:hypothetical protein